MHHLNHYSAALFDLNSSQHLLEQPLTTFLQPITSQDLTLIHTKNMEASKFSTTYLHYVIL